jgi:hypothetical protein
MIDCIPDPSQTKCIHCGWVKSEKIKSWPRRNCPRSPNLEPAAKRLGLTLADCQGFHQELNIWQNHGYPTRTESEIASCEAVCETCGNYGEAVESEGWPEQCLHGCANQVKKREKRLPLEPLWAMATAHCALALWPGDSAPPATVVAVTPQ